MQQPPSAAMHPWEAWACEAQRQLQHQQHRISELEKQVNELSAMIQTAGNKPMYNIEKLEYHFDQLKVERLEGTLNIGMTPPTGNQLADIEQLSIPQPATAPVQASPAPPPDLYREIRSDIDKYLESTAPATLAQLASDLSISLDPYHCRLIVEDLRKQAEPRILYYTEASRGVNGGAEQEITAKKADIIARTIRDIEQAMRQYVAGLHSNQQSAHGKSMNGISPMQSSGVPPFIGSE